MTDFAALAQAQEEATAISQGRQPTEQMLLGQSPVPLSLFEQTPPPAVSDNIAANRAQDETVLTGQQDFQERFNNQKQDGIVMDEAVQRILDLNKESKIAEIVSDESIPFDQKQDAIRFEMDRISYRKLAPYDEVLFQAMRTDGGAMIPLDRVNKHFEELPASSLRELSKMTRERQLQRGRNDVNEVAAAHGWVNFGDMAAEVAVQDFIPIWNVATRIGLSKAMAEAGGIEMSWVDGLLPGSARARIRETLVSMDPAEYNDTIKLMKDAMIDIQKDPLLGPLITDYNAMEFWTAVFNEDVLTQENSEDNVDLIMGNLELGLEAVFGAMIVGKMGGAGMKAAFRQANKVKAKQVAVSMRNGEGVKKLTDMLAEDALAAKFQVNADAAVPGDLPKPKPLADDIEYAPDGVRQLVANNERIRSELLESNTIHRGQGLLTVADRANVIRETIKEIDEFDGAMVHSKMSTVEFMPNDEGTIVTAVFGETPNRGWVSFEDAANEMLNLDPQLRQLQIMRVGDDGNLKALDLTPEEFARAVTGEGLSPTRTGELIGADEFFIQYRQERAWHPFDKQFFDPGTVASSWARSLLTPNAKFDDFFYAEFAKASLDEQRTVSLLNQMSNDYRVLGVADKRIVNSTFEWAEEFGKVQGREAGFHEIVAAHPDMTPKQLQGYFAMRNTTDTMYDLLNNRLFREFQSQGFQTARAVDPEMGTYHGKIFANATDAGKGWAMDPSTQKAIKMSDKDLADLYMTGGSIMELDMAVDTTLAGVKSRRIIIRPATHEITSLDARPLTYHPGYTMRFYDDPFYVVKEIDGVVVDGARAGTQSEAIRTAGTFVEGNSWAKRANFSIKKRYGEGAPTFRVVRASDIAVEDSSLFQKQVLQREGRLFYDKRNFEALPNVNGNRATLEDPNIALDRGIHVASRQLTHEDPMRLVKKTWFRQYGKFLDNPKLAEKSSMRAVEEELSRHIANAADPTVKQSLNEAREYIKYLRIMDGTGDNAVPYIRSKLIAVGQALQGFIGPGAKRNRVYRGFENWASQADPFKFGRSIAFTLFMRLRPVRQFIMQTAQVGFLAGLDPLYVTSGRIFADMTALQLGADAFRKGSMIGDVPASVLAKSMGLSIKQYRKLVKMFDRSGLKDTVDVHSYTGTTVKANAQALPTGNPLSGAAYHTKTLASKTGNALGKGFTVGEGNNLSGTYMIALRRYMKENKIDDLLKMNDNDWDKLRVKTSNMALAMIKPNNMKYQTGMFSMATQFLSFTHKATLALVGKNPSLSASDAIKLWISGGLLYGAEFSGMGAFVGAVLKESGVERAIDQEVPGVGESFGNLLQYGLIESMFNTLIETISNEEQDDLDLSFLAPGPDLTMLYDNTLKTIISDPWSASFGPVASIAGKVGDGMMFAYKTAAGDPDMPVEDKFLLGAEAILTGTIPWANDMMQSYYMAKLDRYYTTSGQPLPLQPTMSAIVARAIGGIRTKEELALFSMRRNWFASDSAVNAFVKTQKDYIGKLVTMYYGGQMTREAVEKQMVLMHEMYDDLPEGRRAEVLERVWVEDREDGLPSVIDLVVEQMEKGSFDYRVLDALDNMDGYDLGEIELLKEMYLDVYKQKTGQEREIKKRLDN